MKSQNKNNKLAFNSNAVMELNDNQLNEINGGAKKSLGAALVVVFTLAAFYAL